MGQKNKKGLKVLVVDDTVVYRKIVSDVLTELPDVEVVGFAHNGRVAMSKIASLKPDLLTLDIEMPEMNGLEVLASMQRESLDVGAVMVSTLTQQGGELTMRALELGAFDFITKPQAGGMEDNKKVVKEAIAPIVRAFARSNEIKSLLKRKPFLSKAGMGKAKSSYPVQHINRITGREKASSEIVAIGVSTGGPKALARMIPKIPTDLGAPILIVQHMPPVFTQSLAKSLDAKCSMSVREAVDGEPVQPGEVLIAPGGKQMKVVAGGDGRSRVVRITDDPPENNCKPSVDYLFRSIAHHYIERATGVIMTGMGRDGFLGLKLMKRNGAKIIAQNEASCVVYGMPKEPVESGIADVVVPLDLIAKEISRTVK